MSETNYSDDPRLTAYALDELGAEERAEVEALLAKDENARRVVEQIRATAALVASELSLGEGAALTAEQRAVVAARAASPRVLMTGRVLGLHPWHWIAAAASFAAVAGVVVLAQGKQWSHKASETAAVMRPSMGVRIRPKLEEGADERAEFRPPETLDRNEIPPATKQPAAGPVDIAQDAKPAIACADTADYESGKVERDELPSGATGGTSIGVGRKPPSAMAARRDHGAGKGGGGLGPPPKPRPDVPVNVSGIFDEVNSPPTASYAHVEDNPFHLVKDAPLSTFGADVDTASYANVRRFLNDGHLPPAGAVRVEEMINYFPYDYAPPTDGRPFSVRVDVAGCPWKADHRLVKIGIKGKVVAAQARPAANLVFLLDVSGSMSPANRLPLILQSMKLLVDQLQPKDRVAIVVYAGESGVALPSTSCEEKAKILAALDSLHAGGSTNGAAGIELAYQIALQNKIEGGVNRVILATDGDFNVGVSDESSLVKMIEAKRASGVFLSALGVGEDNFKDAMMTKLADHGNGNYAYVDTLKEARKALVEQCEGTLVVIAKDMKLQVEFNPAQVGAWRLVGYEKRLLAAEDFKDDKKDSGDVGAGHTVTALYEIVPPGATQTAGVDPLKYQAPPAPVVGASRELLTVKLRWKEPNSDVSTPMEVPVTDEGLSYSSASPDFKFAASVAAFGMSLRGSPYKGDVTPRGILELATEGAGYDPGGYRKEFVGLVGRAIELGLK